MTPSSPSRTARADAPVANASEPAAPLPAARKPTLLLVDDDKVVCRYFEVLLQRSGKYDLEIVHDAAAAFETLSSGLVDLILTDLKMPEVDGFRFIQRLQREPRWRDIPVVMISTEGGVASKLNAFQLGVHDYVTKPVNMVEFVGRIDAILKRTASMRRNLDRRYNLAGDFTGISFADLINLLSFGERTGSLTVLTPRAAGKLHFVAGTLYDAQYGNLEGAVAFNALMRERGGQFEYSPFAPGSATPERRIFQSCMGLMMEAARLMDEDGARQGGSSPADSEAPRHLPKEPTRQGPRASAQPSAALLRTLEEGLNGAFTLGELALLDAEGLERFTSAPGSEQRFHVLLIADPLDGASALTSLASPLKEGHIASALRARALSLALSFEFADSVSADVVLLDSRTPATLLEALQLRPSVLLLAPQNGDWLSMGVEPCVAVAQLIETLQPAVVFGIGSATLGEALLDVVAVANAKVPIRTHQGTLSESGFDFREALVEALRFWAESNKEGAP